MVQQTSHVIEINWSNSNTEMCGWVQSCGVSLSKKSIIFYIRSDAREMSNMCNMDLDKLVEHTKPDPNNSVQLVLSIRYACMHRSTTSQRVN